jgi:DNA-binding XRE family transcriptional regulator
MRIVNIPEMFNLNEIDLIDNKKIIPSFSIDGLPKRIRELIKDCTDVYQSPVEFWAMSFLMATSASIKNRAYLQTKYKNYPQLWAMLVAPSGIGKTEPLNIPFRPIEKYDMFCYNAFLSELKTWREDCAYAKKNKLAEPLKPICKQSLINDTTPEALFQCLFDNGGVTLFRDELSGWFADFGRYSKSGEISHYLSIFNNKQIKINRKGTDVLPIDNPCLNIFGGIQNGVLTKTLLEHGADEDGMSQRFLYVMPEKIIKPKYHIGTVNMDLQNWYNGYITEILNYNFPPDCKYLLSVEAEKLFISFSDKMTDMVNNTGDDYLRSVYAKMDIHCLRLALTVYMAKLFSDEITDDQDMFIKSDTVEYAIRICEYFTFQAEKIYDLIKNPNKNKLGKGELIRELNKESPIQNQTQFAESLGVTRQYISKILK